MPVFDVGRKSPALALCLAAAWAPGCSKATPNAEPVASTPRPPPAELAAPRTRSATTESAIVIGFDASDAPDGNRATDAAAAGEDASPATADAAVATNSDMLFVPPGPFTMGADRGGETDEHPAHTVSLLGFWLDRTEVTHATYDECTRAKACREKDIHVASRAHAGPDARFQGPNQPVDGVSWDDARAYCAFRGKRLPREAEFEKAMRGSDGRKFPWGNDPPNEKRAVYNRMFGRDATEDVGTHPDGRGPYGHEDLAGNVWEWVEDAYDPIAYSRPGASEGRPGTCAEILATLNKLRAEGKQGFTGSNPIPNECERVLRGGAFNYFGEGLRASNRVHHPATFRLVMSGFRCAKDG